MPRARDTSAPPRDRSGRIQVLQRAAQLLRALEDEPNGLSLSALATRTQLPRSTVHRIATALEREGFLTAASPAGGVRLGPDLVRLAESGRPNLEAQLRPIMARLHERLDETVDLAVLDGDHLRFVAQIAAHHRLRAVSSVGATFPLHCTANGKAALSLLSDRAVEELLPSRLASYSPATLTSRSALIAELQRVRETGVAIDREEHTDGIWAAGFAVRDTFGTPVAVSVPVPAMRAAGREPEVVAALTAARAAALLAVSRSAAA